MRARMSIFTLMLIVTMAGVAFWVAAASAAVRQQHMAALRAEHAARAALDAQRANAAVPAAPDAAVGKDREALLRENQALRARVAELEAKLPVSDPPPSPPSDLPGPSPSR